MDGGGGGAGHQGRLCGQPTGPQGPGQGEGLTALEI